MVNGLMLTFYPITELRRVQLYLDSLRSLGVDFIKITWEENTATSASHKTAMLSAIEGAQVETALGNLSDGEKEKEKRKKENERGSEIN